MSASVRARLSPLPSLPFSLLHSPCFLRRLLLQHLSLSLVPPTLRHKGEYTGQGRDRDYARNDIMIRTISATQADCKIKPKPKGGAAKANAWGGGGRQTKNTWGGNNSNNNRSRNRNRGRRR